MAPRASRRQVLSGLGGTLAGLAARRARAVEPLRIGFLASLTGPLSSSAIAESAGIAHAITEINQAGGVGGRPISLVTRDTAGDPTKAVNYAQQLVFSERVDCVIGPVNSGESLATVPILARANMPNIIIGTLDELIDPVRYPLAFRAINTNEQWVRPATGYALKTLKRRHVALIGDTTGYGTMSAKQGTATLAEAGVKPVYTVLIDPNKTDLSDEISKARAAGADVIMPWSASTGLLGRLLNARGDMRWEVPVVGHPALMGWPIKNLLNRAEYWRNTFAAGYVSTTYGRDGKLPAPTAALIEAMRPDLGGRIDFTFWWVALGYDCIKIIAHAVTKAGGTDPTAIGKALEATPSLPGVYATYGWSKTRHDGFPDSGIIMDAADTMREGCFQPAPDAVP